MLGCDLSHARHLSKISRPDRCDLWNDRMDAGVQHRYQHVGNRRRGTGAPSSDPIEPDCQRGTHLRCWQRWPYTAAMRHDEEHLFTPDFLLRQAGVLAVPDLRRQPVHRGLAGEGAIDHLTAGRDRPAGTVGQPDLRAVGDGEQVLKC